MKTFTLKIFDKTNVVLYEVEYTERVNAEKTGALFQKQGLNFEIIENE